MTMTDVAHEVRVWIEIGKVAILVPPFGLWVVSVRREDVVEDRHHRLADIADDCRGDARLPATGQQDRAEFADREVDPIQRQLLAMIGLIMRKRTMGEGHFAIHHAP